MRIVSFPGLGLELEVPKIAFNILGIDIYWYAVCIVFAIVVSLVLCKISKENYYIKFENVIDGIILALIVGIIGARIYYVIFNLQYYLLNPLKIFNLRDGGLAIYGGLIAGAYVIIKKCKTYRVRPEEFFDYIVPFVALAQSIGRWGNFFNLEAYGIETTSIFRMGIHTMQGYIEVHPVFLYECIACFIIFLLLRKMQKNRKFVGQICYSYLAMYSFVRFFLEGIRIDSLMFLGFRISQVLSVIIFVYSCGFLMKNFIKNRKTSNPAKK